MIPTIYDFLSHAQRTDVQARTMTLDVSGAVQQAINETAANYGNTPMGQLWAPAGAYRLDKPIFQPSSVEVIGAGQGRSEPYSLANTQFVWAGDTGTDMWTFGANGSGNTSGGGAQRIRFDAGGRADSSFTVRDATAFTLESLEFANGVKRGLYLNNTPTQPYPTFAFYCRNLSIFQRWNTPDANGIEFYTPSPCIPPAGIAAGLWDMCTVQHSNGAGVLINGGDNHQWNRLLTFRDNSESGPGVWFATPVADGVTSGGHLFLNPACSGGFRFDNASTFIGTRLVNLDDYDINTGVTPIFGAAADSVVATTQSGKCWGKQCS